MVTKNFFVISFLPTLCSHFEVGRKFAECSAEYYIRESRVFRRRFAECSAEGSPNVPKNIILGGVLGYTYMEITSPIYF
jgi:hypothetical protein